MFRILSLLSLFAVVLGCTAQDDLAANDLKYLDGFLKECKSRQAMYVREIERRANGRYQATLVSIHGDTVLIGEYSDKTCQVPHGRFAYFHENGQVESMGYYNSSRKVGTWKRFKKDGEAKSFIRYPGNVPEEIIRTNNIVVKDMDPELEDVEGLRQDSEPGSLLGPEESTAPAAEQKRYPVLKEGVELEMRTTSPVPAATNNTVERSPSSNGGKQMMKGMEENDRIVGPGTGTSMIRGVPVVW